MSNFKPAVYLRKTNIYEVNIRQYTTEGTFSAFALHLPRLKDMGVEIVWLMPVHPIGILNRKGSLGSYYSIKDFTDINSEFGTTKDFEDLVTNIHELGMKVILDWVANHAAWDNVWTITNPSFFIRDEQGSFLSAYGWEDVIQIDHSNVIQQDAMINAMKGWVTGYDIDGFRADLAHLTPLSFWKKAREATGELKKDLIWLAETEEVDYHKAFDITFTWEWMHATESYFKSNGDIYSLISLLQKSAINFPSQAHRMYFTSNHDENTWNGTECEKYGNYVNALTVFNCTYNSVPMIYSGQELPNYKRLLFFDKDKIDWNEDLSLQAFYKTLLELRKRNTSIFSGDDNNVVFLQDAASVNVLGFYRCAGKENIIVLLNLSKLHTEVKIHESQLHGSYLNIFNKELFEITNEFHVAIPSAGYVVLERTIT